MEIEATKRELAWLKRLETLIKQQPPGTWVFLDGGGGGARLNLMRYGPDGKKVTTHSGGVDQDYIIDTVNTENWDGGGW